MISAASHENTLSRKTVYKNLLIVRMISCLKIALDYQSNDQLMNQLMILGILLKHSYVSQIPFEMFQILNQT